MELHYDTMRKRSNERAGWPTFRKTPSMDRAYTAIAGYSGLIPGKVSSNVCGCSHKVGSQLSYEIRGRDLPEPMSSSPFTLGAKSMIRSNSSPGLSFGQTR